MQSRCRIHCRRVFGRNGRGRSSTGCSGMRGSGLGGAGLMPRPFHRTAGVALIPVNAWASARAHADRVTKFR
jgi:hypothetical protein